MDLSIVIVNWNTRELLRACLGSLRTALEGSPLRAELIVVDNGSADDSAAMVAEAFPEARLVANRENRNYAAGNNQGLSLAEGEYQLLLNPDTEVPPGALERLVEFLRERPDAGAVAPALVGPDGDVQPSVRGFPTPLAIIGELTGLARLFPGSSLGGYRPRDLPQDRPSRVDQPMASAFLVRKVVLEVVELFDEQFPLFFNDVDLCWRIKHGGWEIWYEPRVRVLHVGGASTRQVRPRAILMSHEGLGRFYAKHYQDRLFWPVYAAIVITIFLAGWLRVGVALLQERGGNGGGDPDS